MFEQLREHMAGTARQLLQNSLEATGDVAEAGKTVVDEMVQRSTELLDDEGSTKE